MRSVALASFLVAVGLGACGEHGEPPASPPPAAEPAPVAASEPPPPPPVEVAPARPRLDGPRAEVPGGSFEAGSVPGTPFRRASREADRVVVSLEGFSIDRRPYPNDPTLAPLLVRSRSEAEALCSERDGRLCTELEWERACGGPEAALYPSGAELDVDACMRDPSSCASPFGILDMGIEHAEWTASTLAAEGARPERALLRGARAEQPAPLHRCAARTEQPTVEGAPLAFRCCHGPASTVPYPSPDMSRVFEDVTLDAEALRAILRDVPELARWADDFTPYDATDGDRALARGSVTREALMGWELANGPFYWSPTPGDRALVFAGRSGADTLLVALYPKPTTGFWHAASFVLENETVPIAISRTPPTREELQWTACFGCGAESGAFRLGEDGVIRIAAR